MNEQANNQQANNDPAALPHPMQTLQATDAHQSMVTQQRINALNHANTNHGIVLSMATARVLAATIDDQKGPQNWLQGRELIEGVLSTRKPPADQNVWRDKIEYSYRENATGTFSLTIICLQTRMDLGRRLARLL
ncbi:hypothetical protein MTO96_029824 [Rhipicephalus appendiculatus]